MADMNLFDLSNRVALISGAASGMGRAAAIALAAYGADLVLADLNAAGLKNTAKEVEDLGRRAIAVNCNVSDPEAIRAMFARVDSEFGRIDFLGNIAGEGFLAKPEDITLDQVQQVFQNLVFGRLCMCQEAGRRMLQAGKGSILNIGSLASTTALGRGHIAYSMAMGAVVQMTRELSTEWSGLGVRVNAILPVFPSGVWVCRRIFRVWWYCWLRMLPLGSREQPFRWMAVTLQRTLEQRCGEPHE
jgi:NAD(P)-dependent dehydrogenase (short-subunit alcohol dehydrogenase family)